MSHHDDLPSHYCQGCAEPESMCKCPPRKPHPEYLRGRAAAQTEIEQLQVDVAEQRCRAETFKTDWLRAVTTARLAESPTCKTCRYYRDASPIIAITPNYCRMWVAFIPHTVQTCSAHEPKENQ